MKVLLTTYPSKHAVLFCMTDRPCYYNKVCLGLLVVLALGMVSCGGKKHDAAYYMEMVDSIRKAEQVKDIQQKAGIYNDPMEAWFDTLAIHTLPIKTAGSDIGQIGYFASVPMNINEHFGYPVSAKLKALALPSAYRRQVVMLAEMVDSITPVLYLYTMDKKHQPIDKLLIYEQRSEDRADDFGQTYMEYYITSKYEITLLSLYQSHDQDAKPEMLNARRYIITKEGRFEETIIEIE